MKAEEKTLITEVLEKTLNIPTDEVSQLFNENGTEFDFKPEAKKIILDQNAARVKKFKEAEETAFKNGQKKATKENSDNRDKEIKEAFKFESEEIGVDLIKAIVAANSKASEIDEEKVKLHPAYIKLEKEAAKKFKEQEEAFKTEREKADKEKNAEKTFTNVTSKAKQVLKTLNPIFGTEDEKKIESQISKLLIADLKEFDFVEQDGDIVIMTKEGKRYEDEHGKAVSFSTFVKDFASQHWEFAEGREHAGSSASNDAAARAAAAAAGKTIYKGKLPKTEQEYNEAFAKETDAGQRVALTEEFFAKTS